MTEREFDKLIEKTLAEYGDQYFTEPEAPAHSFTPEFDRRVMAAAKGGKKKKKGQLLRIFAGIGAAAAVVVLGIAVAGVFRNGLADIPISQQQMATTANSASSSDDPEESSSTKFGSLADSNDYEDGIREGEQAPEGNSSYTNKSATIANNAAVPDNDMAEAADGPDTKQTDNFGTDEPSAYERPVYDPDPEDELSSAGSPAEETPDTSALPSQSSAPEAVTAIRRGETLALSDREVSAIEAMAAEYISDTDKIVKTYLTPDDISHFIENGYCITVRPQKDITVLSGDTDKTVDIITLLIGDENSFAIAEGDGLYLCYIIPDPSDLIRYIEG